MFVDHEVEAYASKNQITVAWNSVTTAWWHFLSTLPRRLYLVAGFNHLEKYESQWEGLSHILWKIKKCSKPPTRYISQKRRDMIKKKKKHETWNILQPSARSQCHPPGHLLGLFLQLEKSIAVDPDWKLARLLGSFRGKVLVNHSTPKTKIRRKILLLKSRQVTFPMFIVHGEAWTFSG